MKQGKLTPPNYLYTSPPTRPAQKYPSFKSLKIDENKENSQSQNRTNKLSSESLLKPKILKTTIPTCEDDMISSRIELLVSNKKKPLVQHVCCKSGFFQGQIGSNGFFNGQGCMFFSSGAFYYGQWNNNQPHGVGIYIFETGGWVRGQFKYGLVHGNAELIYQNGDSYQGQWWEGTPHGFGRKIKLGQEITPVWYEFGDKLTQRPQNQNVSFEFMRGNYFEQLLRSQLPQIYLHPDRIVYGLQCDLTGLGCMVFKTGRADIGFFKNGSLEGRGRIIFPSGDIYDGNLMEGQFQGQGQYSNYQDKSLTIGIFGANKIVSIKDKKIMYPPQPFGSLLNQTSSIILDQTTYIENFDIEVIPLLPVEEKIHAKNIYTKIRRRIRLQQRGSTPITCNSPPNQSTNHIAPLKSCKNQESKKFVFVPFSNIEKVNKINNLIGQVLNLSQKPAIINKNQKSKTPNTKDIKKNYQSLAPEQRDSTPSYRLKQSGSLIMKK